MNVALNSFFAWIALILLPLAANGQFAPPILHTPLTTSNVTSTPNAGDSPVFNADNTWHFATPAIAGNFSTNASDAGALFYANVNVAGILTAASTITLNGTTIQINKTTRVSQVLADTNVTAGAGSGIMITGTNGLGNQIPLFVVNSGAGAGISNLVIVNFRNHYSAITNIAELHGTNGTHSAFDAGGGLNIGALNQVGAGNLTVSGKITSVAQTNSGNIETATLDATGNATMKGLLAVTGGTPQLTVNASALVSASSLVGNDTAMFLHFTLGAASQVANSNYFTITFGSSAVSANAVIATMSPMGTNSFAGATGARWTCYTTANTILLYSSPSAPSANFDYGFAIHVDRY